MLVALDFSLAKPKQIVIASKGRAFSKYFEEVARASGNNVAAKNWVCNDVLATLNERNVEITGESREIGPFPIAGVYHLYCTLHQGMNLTIVVQ